MSPDDVFVGPDDKCFVMDGRGNNCGNKPKHVVRYNGKRITLCKGCREAYKAGRWTPSDENFCGR